MVDQVKAEAAPGGWTAFEAVAGWLAAQLLAVLWLSGSVSLEPDRVAGDPQDSIWWFLFGAVGLWLGYLGVSAWLSIRHSGSVMALIGRVASLQGVVIGLAVGVAAQLAVVPVVYTLIGDAIDGDPEASARTLVGLVDSTPGTAALVVAVVVLAPLAEELMYRGVLLRGLAPRLGTGGSIVVTSAIFALAHGQLILIPGLAVFAVMLGLLAHWFQGLTSPIAAHMAFNATTMIILLAG